MATMMHGSDSKNYQFFKNIFYDVTIFKVFTEFVTISFLSYVLVFWPQGMWDLSSRTRDQITPPAFVGKALTSGPPGKSPSESVFK